jgi:hypothetical protein
MGAIGNAIVSGLLCALMATGAGCTALRPIRPSTDPSGPMYSHIESGDEVVLHLRDERRVEITVKLVEPDAIVAEDGTRYGRADITQAEVRAVSPGRVTLITLAAVAGGYLILLLFALANSDCYPYCT